MAFPRPALNTFFFFFKTQFCYIVKQLLNLLPLHICLYGRGAHPSGCFSTNQSLGMLKALHPGLRSRTINIKQTWSDAPKRFADPLQEAHSACPYSSSQAPTCLQPCPGGSDTLLALDRFPSTQESETFQGLIWSEISAPILHTSKELLPRSGEMYLSVSKDGPRKGTKTKKSNKETQDKTNKQTKYPLKTPPNPANPGYILKKAVTK